MNKKIITIAEIVFALIFVVLLAVFMATINSKGNSANNQLVNTLESTGTTSLQNYDGKDVKGSTVVTALDNYKSIGEELKLTMVVTTKAGEGDSKVEYGSVNGSVKAASAADHTGFLYGYADDGSGKELPAYSASAEDEAYINQSANFHCELIKNNNDVVIGIHFVQEGAACAGCAVEAKP